MAVVLSGGQKEPQALGLCSWVLKHAWIVKGAPGGKAGLAVIAQPGLGREDGRCLPASQSPGKVYNRQKLTTAVRFKE